MQYPFPPRISSIPPGWSHFTPPKTNECPLKRDYFNRKCIFQPSFFRGYVSFHGGKVWTKSQSKPWNLPLTGTPRLGYKRLVNWPMVMVSKSPKDRVVPGPLPNGLLIAYNSGVYQPLTGMIFQVDPINHQKLDGRFKYILFSSLLRPYLGKWSNLTIILFRWVGSTTNSTFNHRSSKLSTSIPLHQN